MTRDDIQLLIDAIGDGIPNTALKVRTVLNAIADGTGVTGDVKEIEVSTAYISANFDITGLGTNERLGWAICNGNNGTRNRGKRVSVQYDPSDPIYSTLGATGGSKDAVVVSHSHPSTGNTNIDTGSGDGISRQRAQAETAGIGLNVDVDIESAGVSGTDKNMQPYIISLFIRKI